MTVIDLLHKEGMQLVRSLSSFCGTYTPWVHTGSWPLYSGKNTDGALKNAFAQRWGGDRSKEQPQNDCNTIYLWYNDRRSWLSVRESATLGLDVIQKLNPLFGTG